MATLERWSSKVARSDDGCWLWTGAKLKSGYGVLSDRGRQTTAHRVAFELASGMVVPDGMYVCHHCDNPSCVRIDHLFLGTPSDNMQDCISKGRDNGPAKAHWGDANPARKNPAIRQGTRNGAAKLNENQVREIRSSPKGCWRLSRIYDVSVGAIKRIRNGKGWKHLLLVVLVACCASTAQAQVASTLLQWTAPGDDGNVGRAAIYDGRYSTTRPDTTSQAAMAAWWGTSTPIPGLPSLSLPGAAQSVTVAPPGGFLTGMTYYFVLRTADEVPNWSGYSNVAWRSFQDTTAPAPIIDLR